MISMTGDTDDSLATRPSLLARLKDWSQQTAWREFDHDYAPLVRNVARKAGLNDAEADEVVQETLLAVAKKIGEFEHRGNRGSFRAWLLQQTRWRIADQFRRRGTGGRVPSESPSAATGAPAVPHDDGTGTEEMLHAPEASVPAFERIWDEEWRQGILQLAIARVKRRVSARQFQLFDLHVLQGLSVKDAAATAGATMAAVYMAASRVRRILQRELKTSADEGP
jgi:RNA polymerase sigma-70 factor (ECF subfamily)